MNTLPSGNGSPFSAGSVSLLSSPLPPGNPFESLWQNANDDASRASTKKTPKKRLFAKFFMRQNKSKQHKSMAQQKAHVELLPSHTSVSSASTGFPKTLVEPVSHVGAGSRSIASGSIYTSFSTATTDTQRKEMTCDSLLLGAQDVFGTLVQLSQPRDTHRPPIAATTSSPIVGSTILVAPKVDTAAKVELTPPRRMQPQTKAAPIQSQWAETVTTEPYAHHRKQTPDGRKLQTYTPAAPMRYQEHVTTYLDSAEDRGPSTLYLGGWVEAVDQPLSNVLDGTRIPAFAPMMHTHTTDGMTPRRIPSGTPRERAEHEATTGQTCGSCGADTFLIRDTDFVVCPKCHVMDRLVTTAAIGGQGAIDDCMMEE